MTYILSFIVAFGVTAIAGQILIPVLRRLKAGQSIREDGPTCHTCSPIITLAYRTHQRFFSISRICIIMRKLTVVIYTQGHLISQTLEWSYLQISAYRSRISLYFIFVIRHGLDKIISAIGTLTIISVIIDFISIVIPQIFAVIRIPLIYRIKGR